MAVAPTLEARFLPARRAPAALESYAGRYRTAAGVMVTVGAEGGVLWAAVRGAPPILLLAEGGGLFFSPDNGMSLEFRRGSKGAVRGFVLRQAGQPDLCAERALVAA